MSMEEIKRKIKIEIGQCRWKGSFSVGDYVYVDTNDRIAYDWKELQKLLKGGLKEFDEQTIEEYKQDGKGDILKGYAITALSRRGVFTIFEITP